ncbi:hypothetical protein [Sigmofec virus UA08Rod_6403]|uniref:Uncharacterized protein n=1 Tax=Sigmofec virus UA08Rod_6403 TaxID=2929228 RepID=A0A976R777_9VIRU|nr:hypothetical protein [Sigmofec virus UA08Rod_6403]
MKIKRDFISCDEIPADEINSIVPVYGMYVDKETAERKFGVVGERDVQSDINSELQNSSYIMLRDSLEASISEFDYDFNDVINETVSLNVSDPLKAVYLMRTLEENFNSMPKEVKKKYANNVDNFARSVISGEFASYIEEQRQFSEKNTENISAVAQSTELDELRNELSQLKEQVGASGSSSEKTTRQGE